MTNTLPTTSKQKRLKDMPDSVLEPQWKELLMYWDTPEAKEISMTNKNNRSKQTDMHTLGSTSFAMKENDPQKREPSLAEMYMASRERKVGRTYLTSNDETLENIEKMKALKAQGTSDPYHNVITKKEHNGRLRLHGRGVTKSSLKSNANTPYVLPSVILESITQSIEKKLEDQLERKWSFFMSKVKEANPGKNIVIPDFQAMEPGPCDNVGESYVQSPPPQS